MALNSRWLAGAEAGAFEPYCVSKPAQASLQTAHGNWNAPGLFWHSPPSAQPGQPGLSSLQPEPRGHTR